MAGGPSSFISGVHGGEEVKKTKRAYRGVERGLIVERNRLAESQTEIQ